MERSRTRKERAYMIVKNTETNHFCRIKANTYLSYIFMIVKYNTYHIVFLILLDAVDPCPYNLYSTFFLLPSALVWMGGGGFLSLISTITDTTVDAKTMKSVSGLIS